MYNPLKDHDTCHKCGEVGNCTDSTFDGSDYYYDYECNDCNATWNVMFELTPIDRNNDDD